MKTSGKLPHYIGHNRRMQQLEKLLRKGFQQDLRVRMSPGFYKEQPPLQMEGLALDKQSSAQVITTQKKS